MDHLLENHLWVVFIIGFCSFAFICILVLWIWRLRWIRKIGAADNARTLNPKEMELLAFFRQVSPQKRAAILKKQREYLQRNKIYAPVLKS